MNGQEISFFLLCSVSRLPACEMVTYFKSPAIVPEAQNNDKQEKQSVGSLSLFLRMIYKQVQYSQERERDFLIFYFKKDIMPNLHILSLCVPGIFFLCFANFSLLLEKYFKTKNNKIRRLKLFNETFSRKRSFLRLYSIKYTSHANYTTILSIDVIVQCTYCTSSTCMFYYF